MILKHPDVWLSLVGATNEFGRPMAVYDDGIGPLWLLRDDEGPDRVIRAHTWESAFEIHIDESPTIDADDIIEAYGINCHRLWDSSSWIVELPNNSQIVFPSQQEAHKYALDYIAHVELDLTDGYEWQSNASGTGIVALGYYWRLEPLTPELLSELGITLQVEQESAWC